LDAYGPSRLMWASDCPYQLTAPNTYAASISLIRDRLETLSTSDKEFLLRKTAEKVYFY
ncbi:MAG: amidohydrolase, partial [Verrucomicrobiales bacterium]|nr:amidohydrolase [Verrucomicrobiales bacterium]